ncbi:hypothetical protein [Nocardia sp. NPDC004860]|uniref:hypothetical protein n=1 Tax=Nocardia sp. NPDC004860 TaxID=3154557 RepID=UPI0033BDCB9F
MSQLSATSAQRTLRTRIELFCAACVPVGMVVFAIGLAIAGYIPPPPADDTPQQIAQFYQHHTVLIRFGLLLALTGFGVWGPLVAVITRQMLRIKPRQTTLAYIQLGGGIAAWQFLLVPMLALTAAAFRPDRDPQITQALHDLGWIMLFMPFTPFVVQSVAIAIAALTDTGTAPVFPRWVGYFNLMECLLFLPVGLLTFFKAGPFAYHGVLVFWVPFVIFGAWLVVMAWASYRAVLDEEVAGIDGEAEQHGV